MIPTVVLESKPLLKAVALLSFMSSYRGLRFQVIRSGFPDQLALADHPKAVLLELCCWLLSFPIAAPARVFNPSIIHVGRHRMP